MHTNPLEYCAFTADPVYNVPDEYNITAKSHIEDSITYSLVVVWSGGSAITMRSDLRSRAPMSNFTPLVVAKIISAIKHKLKALNCEPRWHEYEYRRLHVAEQTWHVEVVPNKKTLECNPKLRNQLAVAVLSAAIGSNGSNALQVSAWKSLPSEWRKWDEEAQYAVAIRNLDLI